MKKLMHILFLSCLKATELIEKRMHFKLSATEKLQLKLHKMMCDACSQYEKQSLIIEQGISTIKKDEPLSVDLESFKKAIHKKLAESQ
ncbi:MAG: hypothetical protein IH594_05210 [Bacteroidales bacterium]|nr:hypothetical protein [Bacteroidales bacterium]